ncbi:MAG: signal recognition particle-docking protein FtsY, partial [Thermoplasmata archaeon]|nr:signal recognition particle-docking protein FtsY [Thermoplasmata archaeon]
MFKFLKDKLSGFRKQTTEEFSGPAISEDDGKRIKESRLDDILWDLEVGLMEADVAIEVIEELKENLKADLLNKRVKRGADFEKAINESLKTSITKILETATIDFDDFIQNTEKPAIIMFVGVNGTGKTTTIARIAHRLKKQGKSCVLAAGDTFRAGAIEQLTIHADNLGMKIIKHQAGGDPAAVAYDAVEHAKARFKDIVLIDTAGRMQTNINLMDEMKKIRKVVEPDMTIFVGDSLAGNDAVEQARKFDEAIGLDTAILTKI